MIRSTRECLKHRPCLIDQILDGSREMQAASARGPIPKKREKRIRDGIGNDPERQRLEPGEGKERRSYA